MFINNQGKFCMKINQVKNNINFNSGYNLNIAKMERQINPINTELFFKNSKFKDWGTFYNIDLKGNKAIALANKLCAEIFIKFRQLYDFRQNRCTQTLIFPQDIYAFNKSESDFYNNQQFFVNIESIRPNKNKPTFDPGTVFIDNAFDSLEYINSSAEHLHEENILSTNHFLHNFVHEWLHAQFTNILKARARLGLYYYNRTAQKYEHQKLDDKEKEMVGNLIGTYAFSKEEGQYPELFVESWTKFICESLSDDCESFAKNPVDILKSMPKEFQSLLEKISQVKMYHLYEN